MAISNFTGLLSTALFVFLFLGHRSTAKIQCEEALPHLFPCRPYLLSQDAAPSVPCCIGVATLANLAFDSPVDRKIICRCVKTAVLSMQINWALPIALPNDCHVDIGGFEIGPEVDCDRI